MGNQLTRRTRALRFHSTSLHVIRRDGEVWLRSSQIASALGYATQPDARISDLHKRHAAEFTDRMTQLVKLPTAGGEQEVRLFSLRGAHLLAMFARTERAAEFRRWVLDVLDAQAGGQPPASAPAVPPPPPRLAPALPAPSNDMPEAIRSALNRHAFVLSHAAHELLRAWLIDRAAFKYLGGNGVWRSLEGVEKDLASVGLDEWQLAYHAERARALRKLAEGVKGLTAAWADEMAAHCQALEPDLCPPVGPLHNPVGAALIATAAFVPYLKPERDKG